jgi:hypothetical protein
MISPYAIGNEGIFCYEDGIYRLRGKKKKNRTVFVAVTIEPLEQYG